MAYTMSRTEFKRTTKREALLRSGQQCEAVGPRYGLEDGKRCNAALSYGVEFDHVIEDAMGGDNSLDNCAAVCPTCHKFKTGKGKGEIERAKRRQDKHTGVMRRNPTTFRRPTRKNEDGQTEVFTGFRWKVQR